jgi:NADH-quinone oxidoreductase subunit E
MSLSKDGLDYIKKELARYESRLSAIIPALFQVQKEKGWVSPESIQELAQIMDIPPAQINEVATFYTMFNKKPTGKYHIQVCTNITCSMKKGRELTDYIANKLGVKETEVSSCGRYTVSRVECLGSCDTAPVLQVNFDYHENMNEKKVDELLTRLK